MTADQLRAALWLAEARWSREWVVEPDDLAAIVAFVEAARSWLNLLEADETTVEKVAQVIRSSVYGTPPFEPMDWDSMKDQTKELYRPAARAVLAAIVGEET